MPMRVAQLLQAPLAVVPVARVLPVQRAQPVPQAPTQLQPGLLVAPLPAEPPVRVLQLEVVQAGLVRPQVAALRAQVQQPAVARVAQVLQLVAASQALVLLRLVAQAALVLLRLVAQAAQGPPQPVVQVAQGLRLPAAQVVLVLWVQQAPAPEAMVQPVQQAVMAALVEPLKTPRVRAAMAQPQAAVMPPTTAPLALRMQALAVQVALAVPLMVALAAKVEQ